MASSSGSCPPLGFSAKYYSLSAAGDCVRQSSFFQGKAVLNQGVGYSVILGFGAFFALFTSFLVRLPSLLSFYLKVFISSFWSVCIMGLWALTGYVEMDGWTQIGIQLPEYSSG